MDPVPRRAGLHDPAGVPRPRRRPAGGQRPDPPKVPHDTVAADPQAAIRVAVADVMSRPVITAKPDETLQVLARRMARHDIGCLVVRDQGRVLGIVTERDILREAAAGCRMDRMHAEQMMSQPLVVGAEQDDLSTAVRTMVSNKVKRLPVLRRGRLVGIITFTDFARVEPKYAELFRQALQDAGAQARRKFEGRLPARPPEYTFI